MPSGMEMLLNSFGINPQEMRESIEGFMLTMKTAAEKINANQQRLEAGQLRLEDKIDRVGLTQCVVDRKLDGIGGEVASLNQMAIKLERIEKLIEQPGETTKLTDLDGKDTGVLLTSEKFPQAMLDDAGLESMTRR